MVDKRSGEVEYAVLSFDGLFGMGGDYDSLPWKVLTYDTNQGSYVVDLDKTMLGKAPRYSAGNEPSFDRDYGREVYGYYGATMVSARAMFGEYGLYFDGKMVGIIGDDQLFLKPTAAGRVLAPDAEDVPPYPGAKPYLLIDPDRWEDGDWLTELVRVSAAALPLSKPKPEPRRRRPGN